MWRACCLSGLALLAWPAVTSGGDDIIIHGDNGTETQTAGGVATYFSPAPEMVAPLVCQPTDNGSGQWIVRVDQPGRYTAAIEEAYGFGPVLRPGITVQRDGFQRVSLTLPFAYDLLDNARPSDSAHKEYSQTFVAAGTAITAIVFAGADGVLISMFEVDTDNRQVGATVQADSFYPPEMLPTEPGCKYRLRFVRDDGSAFRMPVTSDDRYVDGNAYLDGEWQRSMDLALRIQHCPDGQILRHKPGMTEVLGQAEVSYGQTFVAKGTGLAMLSVFPSERSPSGSDVTLRLYEEGPGGRPIAPAVASRILVLEPGQVRLTPGTRYYIEVTRSAPDQGPSVWVSRQDEFAGGHLFRDGAPVPVRDLAMILVEYEEDATPPRMPTYPTWRRGMSAHAQRFVADGKVRLIWDIPHDNDIAKVVIRRSGPSGSEGDRKDVTLEEMPVSAVGRYQYVDDGLTNGVTYDYTIRCMDVAGNASEPLHAPATPLAGLPISADLLNRDFSGPQVSHYPYAWMIQTINGAAPSLRTGFSHGRGDTIPAAGWEVPEGVGSSDTVMYQRVPCAVGRRYRLRADLYQWNPWNNQSMVICAAIGIDPRGENDPLSDAVIWSSPTFERGQWTALSAAAMAESDRLTVFLRGHAAFSRLMNVRFRNVKLTDVTHGEPGVEDVLEPAD